MQAKRLIEFGAVVAIQLAWFGTPLDAAPDFAKDVAPILAKYCAGCHNDTDLESNLSLQSFASLEKGGDRGAPVVPGRADASLLLRVLTGEVEPAMPPEGEPRPSDAEVAILRDWIESGAKGPDGAEATYPELTTPEIAAAANVAQYVTSLAVSPDGKSLALGKYRHVEVIDPATKQVIAKTAELLGKINSVAYSKDGSTLVAASGIPGLYGVATICSAADASIVRQIKGHRDALYDARLSPDGTLLATCSYDRQINLWNVASGELVRTLSGHNGAIFELAFSPDGAQLASASADGTVKIWSVATGERLDTLGQPEGEECTVAISPDGNLIVAGGADRQVRMWRLVSRERPEINPLKFSRTAHDGTVVKVAFSPDGTKLVTASESRELVLWNAGKLLPVHRYDQQPDVVTGIAFDSKDSFYVARIDGSWQRYAIAVDGAGVVDEKDSSPAKQIAAEASASGKSMRSETNEQEPNDSPEAATLVGGDSLTRGVIRKAEPGKLADVDLYRFHAKKGQRLVIETNAARNKSPLDSKLEVLDAAGNPVPRVLLQAVRESYFTFRGHNSTDVNDFRLHSSADMELNDYVYANGEVMKLFMQPRGPDSGFLVYPGTGGKRFTYFGSTAISHALNAPCYIVEAHVPGTTIIPNGMPEYTLYYENDDDGWRKLGNDSRIAFTAPADGDYFVRVSDVRGLGGDEFKYELIVRPPRPDFKIKTDAKDLTINAGSGKEFTVTATRVDEFGGEIRIDIVGLPPGFHAATPLVIQAGQIIAYGAITGDADAPPLTAEISKKVRLKASAMIGGKTVKKKAASLGELKLAERPKVLVHVLPYGEAPPALTRASTTSAKPVELVVAPGETISALVKVERNGFDGEVKFGGEFAGRNLPHGVYVDNIGLNGFMLLSGETERQFFITADKWVPETTRQFHLRTDVEGNQISWPVVIHVRHRSGIAETGPKVALESSEAK